MSGHVFGRATDDEAFGPVVVPRGEAVAAARQLRSNIGFLRELHICLLLKSPFHFIMSVCKRTHSVTHLSRFFIWRRDGTVRVEGIQTGFLLIAGSDARLKESTAQILVRLQLH